jgi:hypothetical protein
MDKFQLQCDWLTAGHDEPHVRETTGLLSIVIGGVNLTQNEDLWSKTVRPSVLVSAYPLAMWFASSWWRLNFQPLPAPRQRPDLDWQMGHTMGAANHGFIWPDITFSADGETIQVSAAAHASTGEQSVRYLNGLAAPVAVPLQVFQRGTERFIDDVLNRLYALGHMDTDLARLWRLVQEDRLDPSLAVVRRLEAQLGYDPETCPDGLLDEALCLEDKLGETAMAELSPLYAKGAAFGGLAQDAHAQLSDLRNLLDAPGLRVRPELPAVSLVASQVGLAPWDRGVRCARLLRQALGNPDRPVADVDLYGLLGMSATQFKSWTPSARQRIAVALALDDGYLNFLPRKGANAAKQFEAARFVGDYLAYRSPSSRCLASSDLSTARQKFQRAFAAELLCPIAALHEFLDGDYSEPTVEEAAQHFAVSERVVETVLTYHGHAPSP